MRCKVGDLAVIVRPRSDWARKYIGRIVRILKASTHFENAWEVDPAPKSLEGLIYDIADYALRPIRDNDGEDETLTWKRREIA